MPFNSRWEQVVLPKLAQHFGRWQSGFTLWNCRFVDLVWLYPVVDDPQLDKLQCGQADRCHRDHRLEGDSTSYVIFLSLDFIYIVYLN